MNTKEPSTSQVVLLKIARGVTYFAYAYAIVATLFLWFAFFLRLFSANYTTPFVRFVYNGAANFLEPFRGIFPTHQITATGYLDASALFASLMYLLFAVAVHALINYLTAKIELYEPPVQIAAAKPAVPRGEV
jgi:uncharacterized protein YggT (Ycf19 family)